jgi:hypothetical protein
MKRNPTRSLALLTGLFLLLAVAALAAPAPQDLALCAAPVTGVASAAASPAVATAPEPLWLAKCASCSELQRACKDFCGPNNIDFHCQGSNPCAGTCSCIVPPA